LLLLTPACKQDFAGERLFEITYPVINDIVVPPGTTPVFSYVNSQPQLETRFMQEMLAAEVTIEDIDNVSGLRARVTSLNGEDFGEIERIELRACPVGQANGWDRFDLMFSVDDLFRRRQQTIDLSPGLKNFRELFLTQDAVRMEVIFTPGITTSRTIEARLEWAVQAVGGLD